MSEHLTPEQLVKIAVAALAALVLAGGLSEFLFGRRLSRIGSAVNRLGSGDLGARVGLAA